MSGPPTHKQPATPDHILADLRRKQDADRRQKQQALKRARRLTARVKRRARLIAQWAARARLTRRLAKHGLKTPWLVLVEADRASDRAGVDTSTFRALALAILDREGGGAFKPTPYRYGCDHGAQSGQPPYCQDTVTEARSRAFHLAVHRDPWAYMNGEHLTQTTWYEKLFRVEHEGPTWQPQPHLRVCLGDLAVLVKAGGVWQGAHDYNGTGPAADAYANDVVNARMPKWRAVLAGK
jgi:hypothetical protein